MSNSKQLSRSDLLSASTRMKSSLRILKEINSKANLIAFNAAIEGARTRGRLDSFLIVAEQILTQAFRQLELTEQLEKLADWLTDWLSTLQFTLLHIKVKRQASAAVWV